MAEKVQAEKKNRVVEYLLSEHKLENYLLLFFEQSFPYSL